MAIKTTVCYVATCDKCDEDFEGDYVPHHHTEADARQTVRDCDGATFGEHVWCEDCIPPCSCGHSFADHDHGDQPCDECPCKGYAPALAGAVEGAGA